MTSAPPKHNYPRHLLLFLATCVTTTWAGLMWTGPEAVSFLEGAAGLEPGGIDFTHWWRGLAFAATLLGILMTHEMGHFIAARRHGVDVSLPYFIPFPSAFGTFGAVISMREKVRSRDALMDIGAAGPLAGLVVAIPLLIIGLALSDVHTLPVGVPAGTEGNSILYLGLKLIVTGEILPSGGRDVFLHPIALAAWVGLLVTMINLIPVGQLDGGHVAFAFFGQRYEWASRWFHRLLPVVGLAVFVTVFIIALDRIAPVDGGEIRIWAGGSGELLGPEGRLPIWLNTPWDAVVSAFGAALPWFFWPALLHLLQWMSGGLSHPEVGDQPLSRTRAAVGILVMVVFVLIFTPIPWLAG